MRKGLPVQIEQEYLLEDLVQEGKTLVNLMKSPDKNRSQIAEMYKLSKVKVPGAEEVCNQYFRQEREIEDVDQQLRESDLKKQQVLSLQARVETLKRQEQSPRIQRLESSVFAHRIMLMKKAWENNEESEVG